MKEHPILFSAPMVRAILAGTKTQTRRHLYVIRKFNAERMCFDRRYPPPLLDWNNPQHGPGEGFTLRRAYEVGDRLWVRETWRRACAHADDDTVCIAYRASQTPGSGGLLVNNIPRPAGVELWDGEDAVWRPSIFMPRWASRITLEVTGERVERLQDIIEADAIAEGVYPDKKGRQDDDGAAFYRIGPVRGDSFPIARFAALWELINGFGSWGANPWVRVITFKRVPQ
jgi:hypothetical protein